MDNINLSGPLKRKVTKEPVVGPENSNSAKVKVPDERAASIPEEGGIRREAGKIFTPVLSRVEHS